MVLSEKDVSNLKKHIYYFKQECFRIAILAFLMEQFLTGVEHDINEVGMAIFHFVEHTKPRPDGKSKTKYREVENTLLRDLVKIYAIEALTTAMHLMLVSPVNSPQAINII